MTAAARSWKARAHGRLAPALVATLALLHALLYVWLIPPWQTPDEPTQFEYAALLARLGRVPAPADRDPDLEQQIVDSLLRQRFFDYLTGHPPETPLHSLDDARAVFFMPRQVGVDPPLYFLIASLPIRLLANTSIEAQLLALRLLGALFVAGAALCTYAAARELFDRRPTTDDRRPTDRDTRPETRDQRHETRDTRPETRDQRHETRDTRPETRDQRHETRDTRPETRDQRHETRDTRPETRDQRHETRDTRPETRDQRHETRDTRPETRDQRHETRDTRPETRDQRHETRDTRPETRELKTQNSSSPCHRATLSPCHRLPLAAGLLVALHPMFVFIGVGVGNDGLANLLGAAICWELLRTVRLGPSLRRAAALLGLLLLGILTKRTLLPVVLLLALLGSAWALLRLVRMPLGLAARLGLGGALLALTLGAGAALASGREVDAAAEWWDPATSADAPRTLAAPGTGHAALELAPSQRLVQSLPGITAEWAQNQELFFSARVWTAGEQARGRVLIDFGWATTEVPFEVDQHSQIAHVQTFIPLYCPYVLVAIQSDEGTIFVDQLRVESDRRRGLELLTNGDVGTPALHAGAPLERLTRYLRLRELAWVWRSGRLLEPPPLGWGLGRIFFVSFWGQLGWMSLPLVGDTPWESALGLLCAGGLVGVVVWFARPGQASWRRRAVLLLLALVLAGLLLPLLNAYTQTRDQVIQQGRYLFPAMAPIALLLALGWRALLPLRWRTGALVVWALWWALFAVAAVWLILRAYTLV